MRQFKIAEKEFSFCTNWNELTLRQYINLVKVQQKEKEYTIRTLFMLAIFEVLCNVKDGDLDDMDIETLGHISKDMGFITSNPEFSKIDHITIDGVDYVFSQDLNQLKMSEMITIELLQKKYMDNPIDFIPHLLSVILRPGHKVFDNETKKDVWVQDKFENKNLDYRSELFLDKCKGVDLMGATDFFLNGSQGLTKHLENSMKGKLKMQGSK